MLTSRVRVLLPEWKSWTLCKENLNRIDEPTVSYTVIVSEELEYAFNVTKCKVVITNTNLLRKVIAAAKYCPFIEVSSTLSSTWQLSLKSFTGAHMREASICRKNPERALPVERGRRLDRQLFSRSHP